MCWCKVIGKESEERTTHLGIGKTKSMRKEWGDDVRTDGEEGGESTCTCGAKSKVIKGAKVAQVGNEWMSMRSGDSWDGWKSSV